MIRNLYLLLCFIFLANISLAQSCGCENYLSFVKKHIENNYAGFKDKVTPKNKKQYDAFSNEMLERAKRENKYYYCIGLLKEWLAYFKDGHIFISENDDVKTASIKLDRLKPKVEEVYIPPHILNRLKNAKGIEGIYRTNDSSYKVAVIKSKNKHRDYAAVSITSNPPYWKANQVQFELKQFPKNRLVAYYFYMGEYVQLINVDFDGNNLHNTGWMRERTFDSSFRDTEVVPVAAKKLSDKTFYIQIGTCGSWNIAAIDSTVKANESTLKSTQNLIIDLRGNGGGSDFAWYPLRPYLYTNPIYTFGEDVLSTEQNINTYLSFLSDPNITEQMRDVLRTITTKMKAHPGEFVCLAENDTLVLEKIEPYPKKVAVLIDNGCASATEGFLMEARQSKKVTLMGQNTAGILDFSNIATVSTPDSLMMLVYAASRSRSVDAGKGIDATGIQPHTYLSLNKDWIKEALNYLEKKK